MHLGHWISTVDTHTEGQATRIVTGGIQPLAGRTMQEKKEYFRKNLDSLRKVLILEPRGHRDMYGCVLTEPTVEGSDYGLVFMHNIGYMDMCGHATIGVSTALLELGMVAVQRPETRILLETPGGRVEAHVQVHNGRAESVRFRNVPAHVEYLDKVLNIPDLGRVTVDVAYGGNCFVFFQAEEVGLEVSKNNIKQVIDVAMQIMEAANSQLQLSGSTQSINIATVLAKPLRSGMSYRNVHVFASRQFDRSPGGTGTTARMAVLRAKGELQIDEEVRVESLTSGVFRGWVREERHNGGRVEYVTEVQGSAHVTGFHQFIVDPGDRLQQGFLIPDV